MNKTIITREIKLYDADSLEYAGSIIVKGSEWRFENCTNEDLVSVTSGMPLKAVLVNLIGFNLVYDDIPRTEETGSVN